MQILRVLPIVAFHLYFAFFTITSAQDSHLGSARVVFQTNYGDIEFGFFPKVAPKTVDHIFKLVRLGCYNTNHFFRVDKGFVAQVADVVGGRLAPMNEEQKMEAEKTVVGEFSDVKHVRGILSMGRLWDQMVKMDKGSVSTTNFFIIINDKPLGGCLLWLTMEGLIKGFKVCVYGPPRISGRNLFWEELGDLYRYCGLRWCVVGDFNVVHSPDEKALGGKITRSIRCFNNFIDDSGLFDPPLIEGKFTCANCRASTRIDRVLMSKAWIERFGTLGREFGFWWNTVSKAKKKENVARINDIDYLELNGPLENGLVEERFSVKWSLDEAISPREDEEHVVPFTIEVIEKVVFNCDGNRALGADGFSMAFFQDDWDLIKGDLEGVFKEFFERGILNKLVVETFVCLIPKKDNANKVKDFQPISLITSVYKILAKVLANCLRKVLPLNLSDYRKAFLPRRKILDQALISNEAIEEYRAMSFWNPIYEKIQKRLATWKNGFFSKAGKLTLIKSVLSDIPMYYLSLVRASSGGGLGVGNLRIRNRALLAKWLWCFHLEPDSLWNRIILSKHGSLPFEWITRGVKGTFRNPWKDISIELPTFSQFVSCFIGDEPLVDLAPPKESIFYVIWRTKLGVSFVDLMIEEFLLHPPFSEKGGLL
ncbi:peptidyl-prolyl cis-trans isomerase CYP23 isoform X1 [Cucumis melo var. makuwa]|uniref:Peptidyl-prolyl cis-trans isomerase CYP23 isoform X1 n=1 Tax=Cucumis melo var. makuwa TaxID=1194695 RepID=A0A5D3DEZ6_CUCMM|nr:peptidyl-prolyl cis-trans isomerase CYP23 isoform X1 [Cucumis melo var. makuwa]